MSKKILLVDDTGSLLGDYKAHLSERRDVEWLEALTDFQAVMRAVEHRDIACIIVNYDMPAEISGDKLVLSIRTLLGDIPAILVSAHDAHQKLEAKAFFLDKSNSYWGDMLMEKLEKLDLI